MAFNFKTDLLKGEWLRFFVKHSQSQPLFQRNVYVKLIFLLKVLLILVLSGFVFYKLFYAYKINHLFAEFELKQATGSLFFLAITIVLMAANWGVEAIKWRVLINRFEPISFNTAIKAVLSGVTLSVITPNQIGDFAGRVIHLEVLNKIKGSLVTIIGHTAQVLITLVFGTLAIYYFKALIPLPIWSLHLLVVAVVLSLILFINLGKVYARFEGLIHNSRFEKYLNVFGAYTSTALLQVFVWSMLRYLIFMGQYYLLLLFFNVDIPVLTALSCIIGTFCVQSIVPSFLLLEIGLRGASALAFFGMYTNNQEGILLAAYSLWIINMLLPALIGWVIIFKRKA